MDVPTFKSQVRLVKDLNPGHAAQPSGHLHPLAMGAVLKWLRAGGITGRIPGGEVRWTRC